MSAQRTRALAELAIPAAACASLIQRYAAEDCEPAALADLNALTASIPIAELAESAAAYAVVLAGMRAHPRAVELSLRLAVRQLEQHGYLAVAAEPVIGHLRAAIACERLAEVMTHIGAACAAVDHPAEAFAIFAAVARQLTACDHPAFGFNPIREPYRVHVEIVQLAYAA
jgi:hypothetical protein